MAIRQMGEGKCTDPMMHSGDRVSISQLPPRRRSHIIPIHVVEVDAGLPATTTAFWVFDFPVTVTGGNIPELKISGNSPANVAQFDAVTIAATYGGIVNSGALWSLAVAPTNVAESARVVVPENGVVTVNGGVP